MIVYLETDFSQVEKIPFTGISFKSGFASVIAWIVWPRTFQRFNSKSNYEHFGHCRRTTG